MIALITDTHMGARNNCTVFNEHFLTFFREVFFPTCESRGIETIIHLGDLGDHKRIINTLILDTWNREVFQPLSKYRVWMLSGNHDLFFKHNNSISLQTSLELQTRFGFNTVTQTPKTVMIEDIPVDLVPWISSTNVQEILEFLTRSTSHYLLCHMEIAGAPLHANSVCSESQIDDSILDRYQQVISGHFHCRSHQRNITYIGNPYEIIWSDYNQYKGFALWDPSQNHIEYINNPNTIFVKLFVDSNTNLQSLSTIYWHKKHVRLHTSPEVTRQHLASIIDFIQKQQVLSLNVQPMETTLLQDSSVENLEFPDTFHYMKSYIDNLYNQQSIHLDKLQLIKKLEHIYSLAQTLDG